MCFAIKFNVSTIAHCKLLYLLPFFAATFCLPAFAKTFGQDSRLLSAASLSIAEKIKFSGVGQIECRASESRVYAYTAFLVGEGDTAVTVAHAFDYQKVDASGKPSRERARHNPDKCYFAIYQDGKAVDKIGIRFIMSRWDIPTIYEDPSEDIAVVKLLRTPNMAVKVPGLAVNPTATLLLVSYHADIENGAALRKVSGLSYQVPSGDFAMTKMAKASGISVSNFTNVYISDYDSDNNASGGPIYDPQSDKIVGIHMGSYEPTEASSVFSPSNNFNFGVYFNEAILEFIMSVANSP